MSKSKSGILTEENSIAIDPQGVIRVEKPAADLGFLYVEVRGQDAGRIVFDRRSQKPRKPLLNGKLELIFNQTAFSLENCTRKQKENARWARKQICKSLSGVDATKDQ